MEKWLSVESASTLPCTYEDLSLNPRFCVKSGGVAHICNTSASAETEESLVACGPAGWEEEVVNYTSKAQSQMRQKARTNI